MALIVKSKVYQAKLCCENLNISSITELMFRNELDFFRLNKRALFNKPTDNKIRNAKKKSIISLLSSLFRAYS